MTTQSPSWCLGAVGSNVGVNVHQNFNITDGCFLTPFIYTAIADGGLIIFTYLSYKLARYYKFDGDHNDAENDEEIEDTVDESMTNDHKISRTATINTRRTMGATPMPTSTSISTRGGPRGGTRKGKEMTKQTSLSLVEPAHWKTKPRRHYHGRSKTAPSPAYQVEKSPTYIPSQPIKHKDSFVEPAHWNTNRKPTYEKNYS